MFISRFGSLLWANSGDNLTACSPRVGLTSNRSIKKYTENSMYCLLKIWHELYNNTSFHMTHILRQTEMSQWVLLTWVLGSLLFSLFYVPVYDCKDLALVGGNVWFSYNLTESQVALYGHWGCGTSHHGQLVLISLVCEALLHLLDGLDPAGSIKQPKWRQGVTLISP